MDGRPVRAGQTGAKGMPGTPARVAAIGYQEVEFAADFDPTPEPVRQLLQDKSLKSPSTTVGLDITEKDAAKTLTNPQTIGKQC